VHLFVDLPQRHAAGARQFVRVRLRIELGSSVMVGVAYSWSADLILIQMRSRSKDVQADQGIVESDR
jgi:hypothetical protein